MSLQELRPTISPFSSLYFQKSLMLGSSMSHWTHAHILLPCFCWSFSYTLELARRIFKPIGIIVSLWTYMYILSYSAKIIIFIVYLIHPSSSQWLQKMLYLSTWGWEISTEAKAIFKISFDSWCHMASHILLAVAMEASNIIKVAQVILTLQGCMLWTANSVHCTSQEGYPVLGPSEHFLGGLHPQGSNSMSSPTLNIWPSPALLNWKSNGS